MSLSTTDSFYIVANYTSSKTAYFPNNKPEDFRVKLSKPLDLSQPGWKVGLSELVLKDIYPVPSEGQAYEPVNLYTIDIGVCEGIYIHGRATHSLRLIPHTSDSHTIFTEPFYMAVQTEYIDTFEISMKTLEGNPVSLHTSDNTLITCTLHFRKT